MDIIRRLHLPSSVRTGAGHSTGRLTSLLLVALLSVPLILAALRQDRLGRVDMTGAPSFYCTSLGYRLEEREDAEGNKLRICIFPDGYECEEDAFFNGECGLQYTFCARSGLTPLRREISDGGLRYAACYFPDGSYCLEFDYAFFREKCQRIVTAITCSNMPGGYCPPTPIPLQP